MSMIPYDYRTEKTRDRIMGDRMSYYPNKYYKSSEGNFYYYINTKGYYHILKPRKVNFDGEFSHYEIVDYLLRKDNTIYEVVSFGYFKTKDELMELIKTNLGE